MRPSISAEVLGDLCEALRRQWVKDVEGHGNRPSGNGYDSYDA